MAEITDTQEAYNLQIYEILIIGRGGEVYQIWPGASNLMYDSMKITEGLFEASVIGVLKVRDLLSTMEQINFTGFEQLIIKMENPGIPNSYKSLKFSIFNTKVTGDEVENNMIDEEFNVTDAMIEISFTSYEHYLLNFKYLNELAGLTGADIITRIASAKGSTGPVGLVNMINQQYFKTGKDSTTTQKEMYIEPTQNWIWYKQNQSLYPWSKLNRPMRIAQLMQYLAEYAVHQENPYACNFLFWQDLDRWNFRSIESLLTEKTQKVYSLSTQSFAQSNIFNLNIITEANYMRLFESNAFAAKYYLIRPKWNQPYREYLDYNESHAIREITYDYFRDYNNWQSVERYGLIDRRISTKPTAVNTINDNISGYFSPSYSNREKTVPWEHYGYTFSNRDGSNTWQPMFDQTSLSGATCHLIQKKIKEKIKQKKIEYAQKKNLKEKWKVYRCSICCDTRYRDVTELDNVVFTPEYGVVSAGSFSDLVNFDVKGITSAGATLANRKFPLGLTSSYEFREQPYNMSFGELMYMRETPDIQTKYLYDLEERRVDIARQTLENSKTRIENLKQNALAIPICEDLQLPGCEDPNTFLYGNCFCSEEKKQQYIQKNYDEPLRNRNDLLAAQGANGLNYFDNLKAIIATEKQRFVELYDEFRNRKAFFISKELGFTASNSALNLFNVKSIKRKPIRGSKYEKLAHKSVIPEITKGLTGTTFGFKGFPTGVTSFYPYEVFYNNDSRINPKDIHPYYDSGYNLDVGYQANPAFSFLEANGGPNAGSALDRDPYKMFMYFKTIQAKKNISKTYTTNIVVFDEESGLPDCERTQTQSNVEIKEQKFNASFKDSNPAALTKAKVLGNILETELQKEIALLSSYDINVQRSETSATITATKPFRYCPNKTDKVVVVLSVSQNKLYTSSNGNSYLTQIDSDGGIAVLRPFGLENIPNFNPIEFLNSRNFTDIPLPPGSGLTGNMYSDVIPTETILEQFESYIRVEFEKPVGTNTLYDFPKGFYDTPGSEYYLPYIVLLTTGPFGRKSVDYNISVIGQDPFGFDVAVKRIKKKKQDLKPQNKALVNNKDYHVITKGYGRSLYYNGYATTNSVDAPYDYQTTDLPSYGLAPYNLYGQPYYNYLLYNTFNGWYSDGYSSADTDNLRVGFDTFQNAYLRNSNYSRYAYSLSLTEVFYNDLIQNITRKNPLSLPNSYFEFSNMRVYGAKPIYNITNDYPSSFATEPGSTTLVQNGSLSQGSDFGFVGDLEKILLPGNVFGYISSNGKQIEIDKNYFKSNASYPGPAKSNNWLSFFELDLRDRNTRIVPAAETAFYGYYYGVATWQHPTVAGLTASVWKNDISGETEYGIVGPELDEDDSEFDRNFAAQFVVMSRQSIEDPCAGYICSNPNPVDNGPCPSNNPLCNCPCQELRPDKMTTGITGPEPTSAELKKLENEIKECNLIKEVLGEEWLGCVWNDPTSPLNCDCPCIGDKFNQYLQYSQTYCTFWDTPAWRPLYRNAQMLLIKANQIAITVNGDFTVRPGMKVFLNFPKKRYHGKWLVGSITHDISRTKHLMQLVLIRDSESTDHSERANRLSLNTIDTSLSAIVSSMRNTSIQTIAATTTGRGVPSGQGGGGTDDSP